MKNKHSLTFNNLPAADHKLKRIRAHLFPVSIECIAVRKLPRVVHFAYIASSWSWSVNGCLFTNHLAETQVIRVYEFKLFADYLMIFPVIFLVLFAAI